MRRFEAIAPQLAEHGVEVVALSKDAPEQALLHRRRDKLSLQLLCDPDLTIIRDYGVEHRKAIEFSKGGFTVLGIPLALVPSFESMAIPTTLLIDERGVIQWVDQSDDYRIRSAEDRILTEVKRVFGEAAQAPE